MSTEGTMTQKPRLLNRVRPAIRTHHFSCRNVSYGGRFILSPVVIV